MKKKFLTMNLANNAVEIVVARSYWKAMERARNIFGSKNVRVWEDGLSSQLS
tara:strand:+ start:26 stop:181 length:156 start_codon:yes stop_codon:yes gene_type:complete